MEIKSREETSKQFRERLVNSMDFNEEILTIEDRRNIIRLISEAHSYSKLIERLAEDGYAEFKIGIAVALAREIMERMEVGSKFFNTLIVE